jgi:hypothetical protein
VKRAPFLAVTLVFGVCILGVASPPSALGAAGDAAGLGDRVVAFCKQHKGELVGKGECSNLAEAALEAAGAKQRGPRDPRGDDVGLDGDYVWGKLVLVLEADGRNLKATGQIKDVRPGDIIQFRDAQLAGVRGDGRYTMTATHHTAIVSGIQNNGMVLKVYQQNFNGRRVVMADRFRLTDLHQGRLRIFHPIPQTRSQPTE